MSAVFIWTDDPCFHWLSVSCKKKRKKNKIPLFASYWSLYRKNFEEKPNKSWNMFQIFIKISFIQLWWLINPKQMKSSAYLKRANGAHDTSRAESNARPFTIHRWWHCILCITKSQFIYINMRHIRIDNTNSSFPKSWNHHNGTIHVLQGNKFANFISEPLFEFYE